jgi:hypothetical protein
VLRSSPFVIGEFSAADAVNLIQNGGFETGNFTGWTLVPGSNSIVAQAGQIPGLGPHSGTYFAALEENPPNPYAILSQTISDTPGQPLQLAFSYASAGSCIHCQVFIATWNSSDPFHNVVFVDNRSGAYPYQTVAGTVTGTGSDVVTFFAQSSMSNGDVVTPSFIALDDVSLSVVPGPIAGCGSSGGNRRLRWFSRLVATPSADRLSQARAARHATGRPISRRWPRLASL